MEDKQRLIWGLVHNAHNFRKRGEPLWSVVGRIAGIGSTWAKTLCLDFDMDPDDTGLQQSNPKPPKEHTR